MEMPSLSSPLQAIFQLPSPYATRSLHSKYVSHHPHLNALTPYNKYITRELEREGQSRLHSRKRVYEDSICDSEDTAPVTECSDLRSGKRRCREDHTPYDMPPVDNGPTATDVDPVHLLESQQSYFAVHPPHDYSGRAYSIHPEFAVGNWVSRVQEAAVSMVAPQSVHAARPVCPLPRVIPRFSDGLPMDFVDPVLYDC